MKYTVYYNVPMQVTFDSDAEDAEDGENLLNHALWWARNKSGANVDIVQILPEGTPSQLLRDQPPPARPPPSAGPPTGPKAPAGDQLLARAA